MLKPEIREYLDVLLKMKEVGCILSSRKSLPFLLKALKESDWRHSLEVLDPEGPLPDTTPPALWLTTEEEYEANPSWAEAVRERAAYFFNVE